MPRYIENIGFTGFVLHTTECDRLPSEIKQFQKGQNKNSTTVLREELPYHRRIGALAQETHMSFF